MSKDPKAEVNFNIKIMAGSRPLTDSDRDWAVKILSTILPQLFGRISFYLTSNSDLADRRDRKPLSQEDVMDSMSAVLCENVCSTWFLSGGSKKHLLEAIEEMYTAFEEEMLNTTSPEEEFSGDDLPIPTVKGFGHA